jgi:hypothetical protein
VLPEALESGRDTWALDSGRAKREAGRSKGPMPRPPWVGVSLPLLLDEVVMEEHMEGARGLLADRMVVMGGMLTGAGIIWELRGETRGGVVAGPGSLLLALCTRCSSRCICPIRPRIWCNEREVGMVGTGSAVPPPMDEFRPCLFVGF